MPLERNPSALSNNTCVSGTVNTNNEARYKRGAMSQFKVKTMPGGNKLYTNIGETASQMVMLLAHQQHTEEHKHSPLKSTATS